MDFKKSLVSALSAALEKKVSDEQLSSFIESPKDSKIGAFALPCFKLAPVLKKAPAEIALELQKKFVLPKGIEKAVASGPYLNFFLKKENLAVQVLKQVFQQKEKFGCSKISRKRIMVEYSAPNTNKPLHLGHLRNDSIGMAVSNCLMAVGNTVIKANLYNDRGIHICKSMVAYKKFGKGSSPAKEKIKGDHFVGKFYVLFSKEAGQNPALEEEAQELLKKWESKDKETIALWKKMNSWILNGFRQTYKEFGSKFDIEFFESVFFDKAKPIIEAGIKKGVFEKNSEGALVALLEPELPNKVVLRSDGTSIYATNDLALTKHKFEKFKLDEAIWIVGNEQNLYLQQLFKIFEKLGFSWAKKCRHLSFGMVFLPEGRMKSREGKVVDADDLINEMAFLAAAEIKKRHKGLSEKEVAKRSKKIALSAIKFFLLKIDSAKDMNFDPEKSIAFEGETGPYVQYTYARAKSILRKSKKTGFAKANFGLLKEQSESELVSLLADFPGVVQKTASHLSPHVLCQYLIGLSEKFNSFYHAVPVLQAENKKIAEARLALVAATAQTLKNGLALLNIETLEEM
ncbi:MAG: arginine--tRNA ligase [Candidatus ainarchaeum sp.]|nr:arginine--tRNA ligase [Candidatus ainarchaeum sp.]